MTPLPDTYWRLAAADVMAALDAGDSGLAGGEAARRLAAFGPNRIDGRRRRRLLADLGRRLANPLVAILLAASAVAGATGDMVSFTIIVSMVLLSNILDMVQESRAQATAEALKRAIALKAVVLRDGSPAELPVDGIVPGDIVDLAAGDLWCPPMESCFPRRRPR
jgi:Mg2+-importing ATPase